MHKHFADWLRAAGLEPAPESPKHWNAINEYRPDAEEIVSFARFFYGFTKPNETYLDEFGMTLQDVDPGFSMRDHKQLLSVFVGAGLISVIERCDDQRISDLAALCLLCGASQGLRKTVPVPEFPKIAARYIEARTRDRQSRGNGAYEKGSEGSDPKVERIERELAIVSEETNMLWWLVSGFSRDLNKPWKTVGLLATPIIAAKELADLTRVIPGPVAAAAFLDRIGRFDNTDKFSKPLKIQESIDKTPREWREQFAVDSWPDALEDLMPISNGLKLSLTVPDGDGWSAVFEKGITILADSKMLPNVLAYQLFMERLLSRLHGDLN